MYCPRLDHHVALRRSGKVARCCAMVGGDVFNTLEDMENSSWLASIKQNWV